MFSGVRVLLSSLWSDCWPINLWWLNVGTTGSWPGRSEAWNKLCVNAGILWLCGDKNKPNEPLRKLKHFQVGTENKQTSSDSVSNYIFFRSRGREFTSLRAAAESEVWIFFFEKSHRKSVLLPSRCPAHEESMCHHGDADEGWCHCDLTAVPSAGSLDPIRIHQPRCTVTFRPVPSLWKMLQQLLNRSRATQFIWKGKVREKTSISCS